MQHQAKNSQFSSFRPLLNLLPIENSAKQRQVRAAAQSDAVRREDLELLNMLERA